MPIEFRCSQCGRLLRTPDDSAGRQAQCPECGTVQQVPEGCVVPLPAPAASSAGAGSPFGGSVPPAPSGSPEGSENPFQSPQFGGAASYGPDYAASRLQGPAIGLMVVGGMGLVLRVLGLGVLFFAPHLLRMGNPNAQLAFESGPLNIVLEALALLASIVVIYGAMQMKNLDSYAWAMAATIVGMLPCVGPCCVVGIPIGIWALVVLLDANVKAAFRV